MSWVRLLHRWTGGLIGLFLAVIGLTGALMAHEDTFLRATVPHARDVQVRDPVVIGAALTKIFAQADRPRSVVLASSSVGLHRLNFKVEGRGAYADQAGDGVLRWTSIWQRPEIWIFDLHHQLLLGEVGETTAGILALIALGFVVTGLILWWPSRRLFAPRLWPRTMKRALVIRHHRDLGVLVSPLLVLSLVTGSAMAFTPFAMLVVSPWSRVAEMKAAQVAPKIKGGKLAKDLDWTALLKAAGARYPDGELRVVTLPAKPGGLIAVRLRRQAEWLPNGRTMVWFDPKDGHQVADRDALALPKGLRIYNGFYPLHAGKVGGLAYRLVMTVSGLTLALLGSLAVATFWGDPIGGGRRRKIRSDAVT